MPGTSIAFAGVGWIVVSRLPSNRIGWLMLATGAGFGLGMAGGGVMSWNQVHQEEIPATVLLEWLGTGTFTAILVGAFAGVVVGLQALLSGTTRDDTLAVAGSTLLTFVLFQPVRRRVQRAVDRRFDRTHLDRQQSAEAFASRLRGRTDLGGVETDVIATVAEVLRPGSASLWVRRDVNR